MEHELRVLPSMPHARWCGGQLGGRRILDHDLLRDGMPGRDCCWSGSLAEPDEPPLVWLQRGWQRLSECIADGGTCLLRPRTDHVLNDVPSTRSFFTEHADAGIGLALGPASMLTPGMLPDASDHLVRIFEALGPSAILLLLEDLDETGRPVPLGEGVLPGGLIGSLMEQHLSPTVHVGGLVGSVERASRWLTGGGQVQ